MKVVPVDDLLEVFNGDEWKKSDFHDYAVALLEWGIRKREVEIPDDTPIKY